MSVGGRKAAPFLGARGIGLRLHVGPNAFGNALGSAFADQERRSAGGTATAKAEDAQVKSDGPSATTGSSAAGGGDEDNKQWMADAEAKAKSDADAIAKNVIQQTNDWSNDWINSHLVTVASPSASTAAAKSDPFTSMIEDAATCKTATDCVATSAKYDQQEAAFKDAADKLRDSDPASANFYDNMAKAAHTASGIAAGDAAVLARQQLQDSPPLPAPQSASMQSPAGGYSRYPAYDGDQGDYGIHREPVVVGGNAYAPAVGYISPAAASPWNDDARVHSDPGTIDLERAEQYQSSKTMNIAMLGLGLFGEGVAVVDSAEALWGASRIPTTTAFDISGANSLAGAASNLRYPVGTNADEAFFWSGRTDGVGGEAVARQIAAQNNGTTLERLIEDRQINMPAWNSTDPNVVQAWKAISADYAAGASGTVRAVIGQSLREGNVWETSELPALMKNPNVTQIVTIDPATGAQKIVFTRGGR